ncbi:T-cell immunomodulatory protein-like [Liolophura sinensis]|uniref:T-cell immunomodulatory protein-like n=1 Tax=Liolophura sinensis TaxID=3198878 RepID=UPI0031596EB2
MLGVRHEDFLIFTLVLILLLVSHTKCYLIDVTGDAFGDQSDGFLAAFGDFNSDKKTDLFVITGNGQNLTLLSAKKGGVFGKHVLIKSNSSSTDIITGVMPADFDGDSQMDVLVVKRPSGKNVSPVTVEIHWGDTSSSFALDNKPTVLPDKFVDQPLLLDANGDLMPDLFGETAPGNRSYWLSSANRTIIRREVENGTSPAQLPPLHFPHSSAFVDLNQDLTPDLLVVSEDKDGAVQFERWIISKGNLTWNQTIPMVIPPKGGAWKHVGQVSFVDLNHDQEYNLIVPVCADEDCQESFIYVYTQNKWIKLDVNFLSDLTKTTWGFVPPANNPMADLLTLPISLRVADYTMDGYPDLIVTLQDSKNISSVARPYIFINTPCSTCESFKRNFVIAWDAEDYAKSEPLLVATFFDYEENGNLDMILVSYIESTKQPHLRLLKAVSTDDLCFLKVMVLSGLCNGKCPHGTESYGVNLPGPTTWYHTMTSAGDPQMSTATQLYQSTHFSLQTPYTIIGLGRTPNFVEQFQVGIQRPENMEESLEKTWTYIVPNSQLIVIPTPQTNPSSWKYKLFMTPSELVLLTGASLLGTCGFISIIVGILHWRERVADKKEKLQESQRFHFDAM